MPSRLGSTAKLGKEHFAPLKPTINPSPEERADYVVRQLEHYIREAKKTSVGGMSFPDWQAMAREEISDAIREAEDNVTADERFLTRLLIVVASTLVTIGFWGAAVNTSATYELAGSIIIGLSGLALIFIVIEWGGRKVRRIMRARSRYKRWHKIIEYDTRIKRMQRDMEKRLKKVEEELEEIFGENGSLGRRS